MKKTIRLIIMYVIIVVGLSVVQIFVSNTLSTDGIAMSMMEKKIQAYKKENILLSERIYTLSSLTNIASQAAQLGFTQSTGELVLTTPLSLAIRQ